MICRSDGETIRNRGTRLKPTQVEDLAGDLGLLAGQKEEAEATTTCQPTNRFTHGEEQLDQAVLRHAYKV